MSENSSHRSIAAGFIPREDRTQRLVIGGALMLLTTSGFVKHVAWQGIAALTLQAEMLFTGAFGWCPIYWCCSIRKRQAETDDTI